MAPFESSCSDREIIVEIRMSTEIPLDGDRPFVHVSGTVGAPSSLNNERVEDGTVDSRK